MRLWTILVLVIGCAENAEKRQATTVEGQGEAMETASGGGVTPEQNDAIDALFRRKAQELQSCWQDEYERTHNRQLQGDITVGLTVTPSGKPTGVRILKSSIGSADIDSCVVKAVSGWSFPETSANCPYMRTVHMGAQF
jgi:TonB family protein